MQTELKNKESTFNLYRTKIEKQEIDLKLKNERIAYLEHQNWSADAKN